MTTLHGHKQRVNACDMVVRVTGDVVVTSDDVSEGAAAVLGDWAAMMDEEDNEAPRRRERMQQVKVDDVLVASCSDDGSVQLWRPLEVCVTQLLRSDWLTHFIFRTFCISIGRSIDYCSPFGTVHF